MKRTALTGILVVLVVAGCGSESTDTAVRPSTSTSEAVPGSSSVATAIAPPGLPETPAAPVESAAADTPETRDPGPAPINEPAPPVGTDADMPHGEDLYVETCQRFVTAIDAIAKSGAASREQSVTGMSGQLQSNPRWSTFSPEDQQQMLRGIEAAGKSRC